MEFRVWFEQTDVETAITHAVGGDDTSLDDDAIDRIFNTNTKSLLPDQLDQLVNLGVITNIADDDPQRYNSIISMIKQGILVKDLIDKVNGRDQLPIKSRPDLRGNQVGKSNQSFF